MSARRRAERGFSLIEVLAAVVVMGFFLVALISENGRTLRLAREARDIRHAALLANEKVAEVELGIETGSGGSFDDEEDLAWSSKEEFVEVPLRLPSEDDPYPEDEVPLLTLRTVRISVVSPSYEKPLVEAAIVTIVPSEEDEAP